MYRTGASQGKAGRRDAVRLGEVLRDFMEGGLAPGYSRLARVVEVWQRLLPAALAEHAKVLELGGNELRVGVDSPSYMYEMRLCRARLLAELARLCPGAGVKRIKFVLDS